MSILVKDDFSGRLEENVKIFLEEAVVRQVLIQTRSKRLVVLLDVPYWPDLPLKEQVTQYLRQCYPAEVNLSVQMSCESLAAISDLLASKTLLLDYLADALPSLAPWLTECDFCEAGDL
ncbi:MAG: hypothetical protein KHX08_08435, partial [Clostridiales bacterium]|nr:hypothetical protein [Clostridiales bacterium]